MSEIILRMGREYADGPLEPPTVNGVPVPQAVAAALAAVERAETVEAYSAAVAYYDRLATVLRRRSIHPDGSR